MQFPVSAGAQSVYTGLVVDMIEVTRLNNKLFVLNCELIETVEATPDTIITLTNGKKYVVAEKVEDIVEKVIEYKRKILCRIEE
jgi:flagellar protein FlbD